MRQWPVTRTIKAAPPSSTAQPFHCSSRACEPCSARVVGTVLAVWPVGRSLRHRSTARSVRQPDAQQPTREQHDSDEHDTQRQQQLALLT